MKLTMLLKLVPTPEQANALLDTMRAFNAAANFVAERAFAEQTANSFALQRMAYTDVRQRFGLSAQLTLLAIHKASGAYRRDKRVQPEFRPDGAMTYDSRSMAFKGLTEVSLLTLHGRVRVPFRIGAYQAARMDAVQGQADLIYRTGRWYLAVTLDVPEPPVDAPEEPLGIDLGIVNLATDSDGEHFSGQAVEQTRIRLNTLRAALQKKGTRSAKRHLKKLSGREAKFKKALAS